MRCHRIPTSEGRDTVAPLPCVHHSANAGSESPYVVTRSRPYLFHPLSTCQRVNWPAISFGYQLLLQFSPPFSPQRSPRFSPLLAASLVNWPTGQQINSCKSPYVVTRSRPYLWKALAVGGTSRQLGQHAVLPLPRGKHSPDTRYSILHTLTSLLHLCTGRRPICTFAPRSARSADPTSLPLSVQPSLWASGPLVTHVPLPPCPLAP